MLQIGGVRIVVRQLDDALSLDGIARLRSSRVDDRPGRNGVDPSPNLSSSSRNVLGPCEPVRGSPARCRRPLRRGHAARDVGIGAGLDVTPHRFPQGSSRSLLGAAGRLSSPSSVAPDRLPGLDDCRGQKVSAPGMHWAMMAPLSRRGSTLIASNPASASSSELVDRGGAGHGPVSAWMLSAIARGITCVATTSEIAMRPPGLSTRIASRKTAPLSGDRLITQFEMMTSTDASGTGRCSISPNRNSTFVASIRRALSRALVTISGVAFRPSRPARPRDSPPGLSNPAPLPRSSTVSPGTHGRDRLWIAPEPEVRAFRADPDPLPCTPSPGCLRPRCRSSPRCSHPPLGPPCRPFQRVLT